MGKAFRIFLLGVAIAGIAALIGSRAGRGGPAMQDDAGNPAPG